MSHSPYSKLGNDIRHVSQNSWLLVCSALLESIFELLQWAHYLVLPFYASDWDHVDDLVCILGNHLLYD